MAPTTSRERTAKFRMKRKREKGYNSEEEREKTRIRVAEIRRKKKSIITVGCTRTCKDPKCQLHPERDRKRVFRQKLKGKGKTIYITR